MISKDEKLKISARDIFTRTPLEIQTLIREVLREERDVQHLTRRSDIHARIYDHIRRLIK
jgi:hypothetical protein